MTWVKDFSVKFGSDELRRTISDVNWDIYKPIIKEQLTHLSKQLSDDQNKLLIIDMAEEPDGYGFDCLTFHFADRMTGNMRQVINEDHIAFNHHWQKGAALSITHSATGAVHMILFPSTSEDSGAKNDPLIIHHSYNPKNLTPKRIEKAVKNLIHYHRVTGVLHKVTIKDKFIVRLLKMKMYFLQYTDKENKFKRITALYIPLFSLIVALAAAITSFVALLLTLK